MQLCVLSVADLWGVGSPVVCEWGVHFFCVVLLIDCMLNILPVLIT